MAIGQLIVELGVNIGAYVGGLSKATHEAKAFAREVKDQFESIGSSISSVLGQFGEVGTVMGDVISKLGGAASSAASQFANLGGAMGIVAGAGVGVVAAIAAVGVAGLGLASHAAEGAAKLHELSEVTGVSTETLSRFGYAARQNGVDTDVMTKGLERLSRSAFAAATAPANAVNAYTRLGVAVKDAGGNMRPVEDIAKNVADKIAALPDGATKTALAMQLMGRGGAALIPLFNEGSEGLKKYAAEADAFGVTISAATALAAHQFEQSMGKMKEAGTGFTNKLFAELAPAMQTVADEIVAALKDPDSALNAMVGIVVWCAKVVLTLGEVFATVFSEIKNTIYAGISSIQEFGRSAVGVWDAIKHGSSSELFASIGDSLNAQKKVVANFAADSKATFASLAKSYDGIWNGTGPKANETKPKGDKVDLSRSGKNDTAFIQAAIDKLSAEADAELNLAIAAGKETGSMIEANAAKAAGAVMANLLAEANKKEGTEKEKLIALVKSEANAVEIAYDTRTKAAATFAKDANAATESTISKNTALLVSLQKIHDAYMQGGEAVARLSSGATLEEQKQKLAALNLEMSKQSSMYGDLDPRVVKLREAVAELNTNLKTEDTQLKQIVASQYRVEVDKQTAAIGAQIDALNLKTQALGKSEAAQRAAAVAGKVQEFQAKNPGMDPTQVERYRESLVALDSAEHTYAVNKAADAMDIKLQYTDEIAKLEEIKAASQGNAEVQLAVAAAEQAAIRKTTAEWNAQAMAVGDLHTKMQAFFNEQVAQGQDLGKKIFDSMSKALDDLSTQLANFVVTGKANFKSLLTGLETGVTKSIMQTGISKLVGGIGGAFGFDTSGITGKPDGTSGNPLHVKNVDGAGGIGGSSGIGGALGNIPVVGGFLSKMFGGGAGGAGKPDGTQANPLYVMNASTTLGGAGGGGGVFGGILSSLGSAMGIGLAGGGDVTPGKAYVVGEKHPEFFVPNKAGSVVPTLSTGGDHTTNLSVHFHGVTDPDAFKKSQSQIAAQFHAQAALAYSRTRG